MSNNALRDIIHDAAVRHISAQQLADLTGLDRKTVASILSGETSNPKLETLEAIAAALGGSVVYSTKDSSAAVSSGDISYYRTMIARQEHDIQSKERWIRTLFYTTLGLVGVALVLSFLLCTFIAQ